MRYYMKQQIDMDRIAPMLAAYHLFSVNTTDILYLDESDESVVSKSVVLMQKVKTRHPDRQQWPFSQQELSG